MTSNITHIFLFSVFLCYKRVLYCPLIRDTCQEVATAGGWKISPAQSNTIMCCDVCSVVQQCVQCISVYVLCCVQFSAVDFNVVEECSRVCWGRRKCRKCRTCRNCRICRKYRKCKDQMSLFRHRPGRNVNICQGEQERGKGPYMPDSALQ